MKVTILLLSVDEAPRLERSLPAALSQPRSEVVVLENACTDATVAVAERHGARCLRLTRRLSYAAAINEGIAATRGDAVLLLNADCELEPGFLEAAMPRLSEAGVGSVAPKLLRASPTGDDRAGGEEGAHALRAPEQIDAAAMVVDRRRKNGLVGHGRAADRFAAPAPAFGADGAAALYRRQTLEQCALGGREVLDEDMELWASDADLAWRAQLCGWRCVYEPRARARHLRTYSPSTRPSMSEGSRRLQFRNRYLMIVKNETALGLARDAPWILGYELLVLGHVLLRERHLLAGYRELRRLLPAARRRRAEVQARRRVALPPFGLKPPE